MTTEGRRRATFMASMAFACAFALGSVKAHAGDYVVAQCHGANRGQVASTESADRGDYAMRDECSESPDYALKVIPNTGAAAGHRGYWYWEAPAGTRIVAVDLEAKLRRDSGHKARLYMADEAGRQTALVASGTDGAASFGVEHWAAPVGSTGAARFYAALVCDNNGSNCPAPSEAKTFVRNVELTIRDVSTPTLRLAGDATQGTWVRGDSQLQSRPFDVGGGLATRVLTVNGIAVGQIQTFSCPGFGSTYATALIPCPANRANDEDLMLTSVATPFHDGVNNVLECVNDFANRGQPNATCVPFFMRVDNTAPTLAFHNAQDPADPELIEAAATDATSGIAGGSEQIEYRAVGSEEWEKLQSSFEDGEIRARVDSEAVPPGQYEFRATASDVAGNVGLTSSRGDQAPMVLTFPLKQPVDLDAYFPGGQLKSLTGYRQPGKVRGFLHEPDGTAISGERVTIREQFDAGSLLQRRTERVRTDAEGAFHSKLPGGPSRLISVRYPGSKRYLADRAPQLDFNVRSHVALRVRPRVKAGGFARFHGAVGRYFARVPAGGKLVELQYKKRAKTWNTADEAIGTSDKGDVSVSYRFRRFYTQPVTFVFRLKVTRESSWPYRVPASSKPVSVTVLPRRR